MNLRRHKTYIPSSSAPLFLLCTLGLCRAAWVDEVAVVTTEGDGLVDRVRGSGSA